MPAYKETYKSGKEVWYYQFNGPGSTREHQIRVKAIGFKTKADAIRAEAIRRAEVETEYQMARTGAAVTAAVPTTLGSLMKEFLAQHVEEKLARKTAERYKEQVLYLSADLLAMPLTEVTPLHLSREWTRLLKCGGHTRKKKEPRPLKAKTVRSIAGVVSSAYTRAIRWGLATVNPVTNSEPPIPKKHLAVALTAAEQAIVLQAAGAVRRPWCLRTFLEVCAATAARRGEILALRWADFRDGRVFITRSLSQTKAGISFKTTKTDNPHVVTLPAGTIAALEAHRLRQNEFRKKLGANYHAEEDLIFANEDGTPFQPDSISASVSLLFGKLNLPKGASLHSLRHTHASHLLADGVSLPAVSARLGHSSIRTTAQIYAHVITGQDDDAAKRWEAYQERNAPAASEKAQVQ